MKPRKNSSRITLATVMLLVISSAASAQEQHPLVSSKYWVNIAAFFAARDFDASARSSSGPVPRTIDFESSIGLDDKPDLFMLELGWRFGKKWGVGLQYFRSERDARKTLQEEIEWEDLIFEAGVDLFGKSEVSVTRLVFSRQLLEDGPHRFALGAGVHLLDLEIELSGIATLADQSREFRTSVVSASAPIPNIGAWYRYSPSENWLLGFRADWFSAEVDDIDGHIWNVLAGVNYRVSDHFGIGLAYQYFELDSKIKETNWAGRVETKFNGPALQLSGYW